MSQSNNNDIVCIGPTLLSEQCQKRRHGAKKFSRQYRIINQDLDQRGLWLRCDSEVFVVIRQQCALNLRFSFLCQLDEDTALIDRIIFPFDDVTLR